MVVFSIKKPTARRLRLDVQIQPKHTIKDAKTKLRLIEKELRRIARRYKQAAAKRRAKKR
jgi:hypothetical protein